MFGDENLALKLALEEQKVACSEKASPCAKDSPSYSGKVSDSPSSRDTCWQVIPKSSTNCTIKKTRAPVPVSNTFDELADENSDVGESQLNLINIPQMRALPPLSRSLQRKGSPSQL